MLFAALHKKHAYLFININSGLALLGASSALAFDSSVSVQNLPLAAGWSVSSAEATCALILIFVLMVLNALFHASEAALSGLKRAKIAERSSLEEKERLQYLYDNRQDYFATCTIGFQVARVGIITSAILVSPRLVSWFTGRQEISLGWLLGSILLILFIVALINLLFIELLFRGIARKNPERWGIALFRFLRFSHVLFYPFTWLVHRLESPIARRIGVGPLFSPPVLTEEDLREIVEATEESGELIADEREMLHSVIEFGDTVAREVMTPRTDIDAVEVTATPKEVAHLIETTGHTRIPVYEESIDHIVGVVHAKDVLKALSEGNGKDLRRIIRPAYFIPESKDLHQLLREFRSGRTQMAIVQDEFGGTAGIVTIEDVVEEIVGDIVDEYDVEEVGVQKTSENEWISDGRIHLEDVNDEIEANFKSEEFDTIGGYVFGMFGRQPKVGESVRNGVWELEVLETDGRRIQKVRIRRLNIEEEEGA